MWWNMPNTKLLTKVKVLILVSILIAKAHANQIWDHAVYLNEDYLLQWTVKEPDIVFEVQVKAHGYVGFGFSRDGTIYGADVFIGWFDDSERQTIYYVSIFDTSLEHASLKHP
jgi:DOMON domain